MIAKMKAHFEKQTQIISTAHTMMELCAIRDIMSCKGASKLIALICLE